MRIGELREFIIIQELKLVVNESGGQEKQYVDVYSCRTKKKTVSTKEYINSQSDTTKYVLKFICRKKPNSSFSSKNYVMYKGEVYNIKHIHEFEDMKFIELTVERIV
ncbi:phage head closure protein [Romboutsia sedimentorum]|uniref:phage head closure protein n=1 Tax=Romboutsia sedimentorum TaxID=1368474 RepID=UPI0024DF05EF|nr:phage head closure protein [Romboutsia sedimentorum]MDK2587460.1 phage head closure protein [Romboutsia sedimentorum]